MSRQERRIYQIGVAVAAVLLIAMTAVLTEECSAEKAVYAAPETEVEEILTETGESPEIGQIRAHNANQHAQRVETLEERDEPETSEKEILEPEHSAEADETDQTPAPENKKRAVAQAGQKETTESESEAAAAPLYRIAGDLIPEEIQRTLYEALAAEGIDEWFSGALAQVYQESHGNPYAENPNGLDKGLLQYRITYWPATAAAYGEPGADIFDWRAQVRVYARQAARRINAGLSADEVISRHKTSDDCPALDPAYIQQVRQWLGQMEAAR